MSPGFPELHLATVFITATLRDPKTLKQALGQFSPNSSMSVVIADLRFFFSDVDIEICQLLSEPGIAAARCFLSSSGKIAQQ